MPRQATQPQGAAPHLPYRPAIDGLRAIAVLSVVLYHWGLPGLSGGFAGVDVFFVISGYLIGGLLWRELRDTGTIRLVRFWMRRVRRLAPAYLAMAGATALVASAILLPYDLRQFGRELIAATGFLSNVLYWRDSGYFDGAAEDKLLLHTWSLSVEEQFYIALPLGLLALGWITGRSPRLLAGALGLAWAASLVGCLVVSRTDPIAAFYLFPLRAWELLTGVLLALAHARRNTVASASTGPLGLGLILVALVMVRPEGFPGWQALLPVIGTMMLLHDRDAGSPVNRALALRGPVFVGRISYSLYLWHWPVLGLVTYWRGGWSGAADAALWFGLALLLAVVSWRLVETPLRRSRRWTPLIAGSAAAGLSVFGLGGLAYLGDGLPQRFAADTRVHINASAGFLQDWSRCATADTGRFAGIETCRIGPDGPPEVLIWGDSHLRALMDGLALAADEAATPGLILWHAGCPPLFGLSKSETATTPAEDAACTETNRRLRQAFAEPGGPDRILLVGRWSYYAEGAGYGRDAQNLIALAPLPEDALPGRSDADLFAGALDLTVAELGRSFSQVAVLRQVPELPEYDSRDIARGLAHGTLAPDVAALRMIARPEALTVRVRAAEAPLYALASAERITLIDPWPLLCPDRCTALRDGRSVYFDNNHLNNDGALLLRRVFAPFLAGPA